MVFSGLSFLYMFVPVVGILYFIYPNRQWRNTVLLLASLLFYSWGEPKFVLVMMATVLVAYLGGLMIARYAGENGDPAKKKLVFILTSVLICSVLVVYKYLGFITENLNLMGLGLPVLKLVLPIGISFYTFQVLSYVIDLYKGSVSLQKNYFDLLLYVAFFPQLIAGPIVRYSTVEEELENRKENIDDIAAGMRRFIIGLSKKVLIANGVARFAEIVYAGDAAVYGTLMYWLASIAYSLQIYFDFSGYSDMAIGLGRIFGFHFLENFDHPYISKSITEFWRRWHMSLSGWFRDYIYIPLGGNRVSKARWFFNIMVVWSLTGLWHGASWNFILWGMYYGVLLILEKLLLNGKHLPGIIGWIVTMFIVDIGWVFFNLTDPAQLAVAFKTMFSYVPTSLIDMYAANTGIAEAALYFIPGLIFMFPIGKLTKKIEDSSFGLVISNIWHLALLVLCTVFILSSSYNPFIYFRF